MGLATTGLLLAEGANVATCARDARRLAGAVDALLGADRAASFGCDVLDADAVERFVAGAVERFGRIDGVVNNAGRSRLARWADTTDAEWHTELELKLFGCCGQYGQLCRGCPNQALGRW